MAAGVASPSMPSSSRWISIPVRQPVELHAKAWPHRVSASALAQRMVLRRKQRNHNLRAIRRLHQIWQARLFPVLALKSLWPNFASCS
jgi:hypothetical protein